VNVANWQTAPPNQRATGWAPDSLWSTLPLADEDRRPQLTRERVVTQALTIIAEEGVAAIRSQLHEFFRSLPPERFPALVALGEHVWLDNRDERFAVGLDVLVHGLEQARRSPCEEVSAGC
jgi:hypothetical protein